MVSSITLVSAGLGFGLLWRGNFILKDPLWDGGLP